MWVRSLLAGAALGAVVFSAAGQTVPPPATSPTVYGWRSTPAAAASSAVVPAAATGPVATARPTPGPTTPLSPVDPQKPADAPAAYRPLARVTEGSGALPVTHGQVWREYDISPYTLRVTTTKRPEQAVVDWILRETGYEAWHGEPLGVLSATQRTLRVYHTPQMQAVVAEIVDRFVSSQAASHAFSLRIVSLDQPNWRSRVQRMLRPVPAQTPGVQAWLMEKEDAAILLAELRRRNDFREHSSPQLLVSSGQSTVVSITRARPYVRDVALRNDTWPGFEADAAQIDEGFTMEFSPLLSVDGRLIDATIRCDIDQVERMVPVVLDVPSVAAPRQRTQIEVPQIVRGRCLERFRWPVDQVLMVGLGMVPMPVPSDGRSLIPGLPLALGTTPGRADLLAFIESKGELQAPRSAHTAAREAKTYRGRY